MCQRVTCRVCGKPSFAGCGRHVESVLGDVPKSQRCHGHTEKEEARPSDGSSPNAIGRFFKFLAGGNTRSRP